MFGKATILLPVILQSPVYCTIRYNYSCLNNYRHVRSSMELLRDGRLSCEVSSIKKNGKLQL